MKKLFKKFCILAIVSLLIGYSANKKNEERNMQPQDVAETVITEQMDVNFSLQEVNGTEQPVIQETVVEEKIEIKPTPSPVSTTEPVVTEKQESFKQAAVMDVGKVEAQPTVVPTIIPTATPVPTVQPTATPEPIIVGTPSPAPLSTPALTSQLTATPKPTPVPTVAPTLTPEPQFDINYWIDFAQNYAQSIGLVLERSAVDCWDNPIPAGHHCKNIEQNIIDRLNRYKNLEGFTDVWIWYEETGNNTYNIYIGYE